MEGMVTACCQAWGQAAGENKTVCGGQVLSEMTTHAAS